MKYVLRLAALLAVSLVVSCQESCESKLQQAVESGTADEPSSLTSIGGSVLFPAGGTTAQLRSDGTRDDMDDWEAPVALVFGQTSDEPEAFIDAISFAVLAGSAPAVEGSLVELLDADMDVIAVTEIGMDGTFTFAVDPALLVNAGDDTVFFVRCADSNGDGEVTAEDNSVVMMTVTLGGEVDESALTGLAVDSAGTFQTLLNFAGTGFNPLTANDNTGFPAQINLMLSNPANAIVVSAAEELLADVSDVSDLGADHGRGDGAHSAFPEWAVSSRHWRHDDGRGDESHHEPWRL